MASKPSVVLVQRPPFETGTGRVLWLLVSQSETDGECLQLLR